jgi:hypothetical protein
VKSRRPSPDPKLPIAEPKVRRPRQKQFKNDRDKWLYPDDTTTLAVAIPNELIAEIDGVVDILYPALRDRCDFAYEACRYAIESWHEGISTPEGQALIALAAKKKKRRPARKKARPKQDDCRGQDPIVVAIGAKQYNESRAILQ